MGNCLPTPSSYYLTTSNSGSCGGRIGHEAAKRIKNVLALCRIGQIVLSGTIQILKSIIFVLKHLSLDGAAARIHLITKLRDRLLNSIKSLHNINLVCIVLLLQGIGLCIN